MCVNDLLYSEYALRVTQWYLYSIYIDVTLFIRIVTQGKRTYLSNPVSRNRVSKIIPKIYGVSIQVTRLVNGARGD